MVDHIEATRGNGASRLRRADIRAHEAGAPGNVLLVTPGEIVQHHHFPSPREIRLGNMGSDEACSSRYQYPATHASRLRIHLSTAKGIPAATERPAI